jgi:hypothetical protein
MSIKWFLTIGISIGLSSYVGVVSSESPANTREETITDTLNNLPANPGEEGQLTLSGIDADYDGVRDDVQIAINERYSEDEVKQLALKQSAKAFQNAIAASRLSDPSSIIDASADILQSMSCLYKVMEDPTSEISFIENSVINTTERSDAYIDFNESLNGQFFGENYFNNPCQ